MPTLTITPDTAFSIVLKARQFDAKVEQTDPDSGSNPSDDNSVDALEFGPADDTLHELNSAISDLNDDEQRDLIALIWLGRGDFALGQWAEARGRLARLVETGPSATSPGFPWSAIISRTAFHSSINRWKTTSTDIDALPGRSQWNRSEQPIGCVDSEPVSFDCRPLASTRSRMVDCLSGRRRPDCRYGKPRSPRVTLSPGSDVAITYQTETAFGNRGSTTRFARSSSRPRPAVPSKSAESPDTSLRRAVLARLVADPLVRTAHIRVAAVLGRVTLSGYVTSHAQKNAASAAARGVKGVQQLADDLWVALPCPDVADPPVQGSGAEVTIVPFAGSVCSESHVAGRPRSTREDRVAAFMPPQKE